MRKILLLFSLIFFLLPTEVKAIYDPVSVNNNKYGMHIIDTNDLKEVRDLVNSNEGDWGYVTLVIQKGERTPKRWQDAFDEMRRLHLIPIVRIATASVGEFWEKPSMDEIDGWVDFLNSLNWVVKNRYVIVGNEPNHAKEWGGNIEPQEYAKYLKEFSQKLKNANSDFFIMPAGMDASATSTKTTSGINATMDEKDFIQKMFEGDKNAFDFIDGWSSHSYPNPGFSGEVNDSGKGTIRTFEWELDYLKTLGFMKDLPVFITETGWIHETNKLETNLSEKFESAFTNVWNDKRVIAVTPFIFKYTEAPFDIFSWKNKDGQFYDYYNRVKDLPKEKGEPIQIVKADILTAIVPKIATSNSSYHGVMFVKNTGQSIWKVNNLGVSDERGNRLTIQSMIPESIEPGQIGVFLVVGRFPVLSGRYQTSLVITNNSSIISNWFNQDINLIPGISNLSQVIEYLKAIIGKRIGINM